MAKLDRWAARQGNSCSEAIRRLVEFGLTVNPKSTPTTRARAERASELAARVIDKLTPDGDAEEKATHKRRLIKEPEEFSDVRVDSAKQ
jgi:hypothetical protein